MAASVKNRELCDIQLSDVETVQVKTAALYLSNVISSSQAGLMNNENKVAP